MTSRSPLTPDSSSRASGADSASGPMLNARKTSSGRCAASSRAEAAANSCSCTPNPAAWASANQTSGGCSGGAGKRASASTPTSWPVPRHTTGWTCMASRPADSRRVIRRLLARLSTTPGCSTLAMNSPTLRLSECVAASSLTPVAPGSPPAAPGSALAPRSPPASPGYALAPPGAALPAGVALLTGLPAGRSGGPRAQGGHPLGDLRDVAGGGDGGADELGQAAQPPRVGVGERVRSRADHLQHAHRGRAMVEGHADHRRRAHPAAGGGVDPGVGVGVLAAQRSPAAHRQSGQAVTQAERQPRMRGQAARPADIDQLAFADQLDHRSIGGGDQPHPLIDDPPHDHRRVAQLTDRPLQLMQTIHSAPVQLGSSPTAATDSRAPPGPRDVSGGGGANLSWPATGTTIG